MFTSKLKYWTYTLEQHIKMSYNASDKLLAIII